MKINAFYALLALAVTLVSASAAPTAPEPERLKAAAEVLRIFDAKCTDCHGADLPRPKGKFGYVLDLKRISEQTKYVVKGKPEDSDIYVMVRDDEMPGDDAKVPPLTEAEKNAVKRWIELGAPAPAELSAAAVTKVAAPDPETKQDSAASEQRHDMPFWKKALRWLGHFHPLSTHFPVALMYVAVLAELLAWASKRPSWLTTVRFIMVIAALGAVVAAGLGWLDAWFTSYVGKSASILLWHRWLGTAAAAWATICTVLCFTGDCSEGSKERARFRGALLFGAVLVGVAGFLGSALIYGLDHYSW